MTTLQPSSNITNSAATQGEAKSFLDNIRLFVADLLGTDSSNKVAVAQALGSLFNSSLAKSSAYTVVAADRGKVITCTGTFTLSLTAAATLADGFYVAVWNTGSGTITIDPNGSELIDLASTKALAAGKLFVLYCNGSQFVTVGSITPGSGGGLDADLLDGIHASGFIQTGGALTAAQVTTAFAGLTAGGIGTLAFCAVSGVGIAFGSTISGSLLNPADGGWLASNGYPGTSALTGTWRALGHAVTASNGSGSWWGGATLFIRIA